jgi:hypothetical protein
MAALRLLAIALLACAVCGCALFKDDPIMGDHPWQPGMAPPQKDRSSSTMSQ